MTEGSVMKLKEDRRIRITKKAIKESIIELLQEYPISKISVTMICKSADINRSTFYSHYADQYDLLKSIQQEAIAGIRQYIVNKYFIIEQNKIAIPILIQILEYAKANYTLFKVLLGENSDSNFQTELMFLAKEKTMEESARYNGPDETESKYIEFFVISGIVSIMREWLNNECDEEPERMAELISKLLFQGISGFYG